MRRHLPRLTAMLLTAGCTGEASSGGTPSPGATQGALNVSPASFDLSVGDDQRFLAGLLTNDRSLIVGRQVDVSFFYFGEQPDPVDRELVAETTASHLPVPGDNELTADGGPTVAEASSATGVYETTVTFDRPGTWDVGITATTDGETRRGTGTLTVGAEPQLVAVGEAAPRTDNPTIADEAPPAALDSLAAALDDGEIPDPTLDDTTIAEAVEGGRPVIVVVSTPVYCESRFCGPITETVHDLADSYDGQAEFVHLEVWGDFENQELNRAAAAWIQTEQGANEPWVFLVDADGNLAARWDNVLDLEALEAELDALPAVS